VCEAGQRLAEDRAWYNLAVQANPLDAEAQKALYRLRTPAAPPSSVPGAKTSKPNADLSTHGLSLEAEPAAPGPACFCCLYHCCQASRLAG
jgi:hypothetical protein